MEVAAASGANEPNPFAEDEEAIVLDPLRRKVQQRIASAGSRRPPSSTRNHRQLVRHQSAKDPFAARRRQMQLNSHRSEHNFKEVLEEEVFLTRLVEKDDKMSLRTQMKNTRIWNKSTATTRAPLQRVHDHDFAPARSDENHPNYSYSARNRSLISAAMNVAKQRTLMSAKARSG